MRFAAFLALGCALPLAQPETATPQKKAAPQKKATHSTSTPGKSSGGVHHKTTGSHAKATGKHAKTTAGKRSKGSRTKAAQAWRSRQLAPTSDRYKEIQSALAKRGYLDGSPTGVWDVQSADALKHFQHDQNLEPTGKLNSLSLIALGLGAKRSGAMKPSGASPAPAVHPTGVPAQIPASPDVTPENPPSNPPANPSPAGSDNGKPPA